MSGLAGGVAAAVRRRQQTREPRVLLYDNTGQPRLAVAGPQRDELIAVAERMLAQVDVEDDPLEGEADVGPPGPEASSPPPAG
jgi:hypothetical protein